MSLTFHGLISKWLKEDLGKAKQVLMEGILNSSLYLNVQTLCVSRVIILQNAEAATQKNDFCLSHHSGRHFPVYTSVTFTF